MQLYRELELWSKDDIVPSDLQTVCRISAIKLKKLQAENERLKSQLQCTTADLSTKQAENETLHKKLRILRNAKCPKCQHRFKIQKLSKDAD